MREFTPFKLDNPSLKLSICILKLMGSSIALLFELLVLADKLAVGAFHVKETSVIGFVPDVRSWLCIGNTSNNYEGSINTTTLRVFAISSTSSHGSRRVRKVYQVFR